MSLLWSVALAITPPELADAEVEAEAIVASCEPGRRCLFDDLQLAEAFVVMAAAAAVLRGEIDRESAANAKLLAPEVVEAWVHILPAIDERRASTWVRRRHEGWVEPLPEVEARPAPARIGRPARPPADPPTLGPAPAIVRLGVGTSTDSESRFVGDVEVRANLLRGLAVVGAVTWKASGVRLSGASLGINENHRRIDLGFGPRWVGSHFDGSLYVGWVASHGSATFAHYERGTWGLHLTDPADPADPADRGWGGCLGAVAEVRISRRFRLYGHTRLGAQKRAIAPEYLGPRRDDALFEARGFSDAQRDQRASDLIQGLVQVEIQVVASTHFRFGLGARVDARHNLEFFEWHWRNPVSAIWPRLTTVIVY